MQRRVKPVPEGKIEKPEDKAWKEWYEKLAPKEHEEYLSKLGLGKEDIDEWEATGGFKGATAGGEDSEETEEAPVEKKAVGAAKAKKKK